jgi:dipeptidyl aminopeptidase/acylaminoacyl peptidase
MIPFNPPSRNRLATVHLRAVSSKINRALWHHLNISILLLWTTAGILFIQTSPLSADAGRLPPLESYFTDSNRFAERLSPDGTKVAYMGPDDRAVISLWMVDAKQPENPLQISIGNGDSVRCFFWIGANELLWQSTGPGGRSVLYFKDLKGGGTREILPDEKRAIRLEGVADSDEPCILVSLSDVAFPNLYRVRLRENEAAVLTHSNHHQIITWAWDDLGKPVVGLRWTDKGAKELLSLHDNLARVVFRAEPTDDLRLLMASSDGTRALVITDRDSNFTHAEWIELAGGSREKIGMDPMGRVDLESLLTSGNSILAACYSDDSRRWLALNSGFTSTLEALQNSVGSDSLDILGVDDSGKRVLFKRFSAQDPGTVWLHDVKTGSHQMLWRERPGLDPSSMCETRPIQYKSRDGTRIPAYLTLPKEGKSPWPLVVFPHGGPQMRTHCGFDGRVQLLASRGYAVLQPNFRGSRGYGKAFMNAGDGQWGKGVMQTDVTDGVDHLISGGVVDPKRVAIFGGSYGGYSALAGLAFTPDRYAAGICLFGISDLVEYVTHHPVEWQAYAGDTIRRLGDPSTPLGRKALSDLSPVNHAATFKAPLLIYHGANDQLIPVTHARQMVDALKLRGKDEEHLLASDDGHGFSNPESEMAVYRAIELFLEKHLGGKVGTAPSETVTRRLSGFRTFQN